MSNEISLEEALLSLARGATDVFQRMLESEDWIQMSPGDRFSAHFLTTAKFRRARPKRSRVQEMADAKWRERKGTGWGADYSAREDAIRAACAFLREHTVSGAPFARAADAIEREFLEPR